MAVLGAVAFMLVAGLQFGVSGTEAVFSETEVALEKAIAGSGNESCKWKQFDCPGRFGGSFQAFVLMGMVINVLVVGLQENVKLLRVTYFLATLFFNN